MQGVAVQGKNTVLSSLISIIILPNLDPDPLIYKERRSHQIPIEEYQVRSQWQEDQWIIGYSKLLINTHMIRRVLFDPQQPVLITIRKRERL